MAQGDTYYEDKFGHHYVCVVWKDTPDELIIHKTDVYTGEVRVDKFSPNPKYDDNHTHEFIDSDKYGAHFENSTQKYKDILGSFDPRNKNK